MLAIDMFNVLTSAAIFSGVPMHLARGCGLVEQLVLLLGQCLSVRCKFYNSLQVLQAVQHIIISLQSAECNRCHLDVMKCAETTGVC